jgi:hypothetical protein
MAGNRSKSRATTELVRLGLLPRLLDLEVAAAYVGLSAAAFRAAVSAGRYPPAIEVGRRKHWDLRALDAALDRHSGLTTPSQNLEEMPDDLMRAIDAA